MLEKLDKFLSPIAFILSITTMILHFDQGNNQAGIAWIIISIYTLAHFLELIFSGVYGGSGIKQVILEYKLDTDKLKKDLRELRENIESVEKEYDIKINVTVNEKDA